ncbi:hypothetical protein CR513_44291, partial [Mucuna pruriens]
MTQMFQILSETNAAITAMATKVLISNGFQPEKGLGKDLDDIAEPVALHENPGRFGLGYIEAAEERRLRRKMPGMTRIRLDLYRYFTSGGITSLNQIAMIEDQLLELKEWVVPMSQELDNWTVEALPKLINNATLKLNNVSKSYGQDEGEDPKEEALVEMERLLEQERPKLQSGAEKLETVNLGKEEEK